MGRLATGATIAALAAWLTLVPAAAGRGDPHGHGPYCLGYRATIVGSGHADKLRGTQRRM